MVPTKRDLAVLTLTNLNVNGDADAIRPQARHLVSEVARISKAISWSVILLRRGATIKLFL